MKYLFSIIIVLSSISFAHAQRNPQIRVCNVNNAHFWSLDVEVPQNDKIGFCRFDVSEGTPLMGSISLIKYLWKGDKTQAMAAYLKTKTKAVKNCREAGATYTEGIDSDRIFWDICVFDDYSFVSEQALINGYSSTFNLRLTDILD